MTFLAFIQANRNELDRLINRTLTHVPATASCDCARSRTDHYHDELTRLNDEERRLWVLNDENLYRWARSEGVRI